MVFLHKGMFSPPDTLSEDEREIYNQGLRALNESFYLRELFGSDEITSEMAADKYLDLAEKQKIEKGERLEELERSIVLIGSAFEIQNEKSGIGDLLSASSRGTENVWVEKIRSAKLKLIIQKAFVYLRKNKKVK